jgi:hypothetical protein
VGATESGGAGLEFDALDISQPYFDPTGGHVYWLSSHLAGGSYEVRLNVIYCGVGGYASWYLDVWPSGVSYANLGVVYTATAAPDLKATGAISRTLDWRSVVEGDMYQPLMVAFVADGALRVSSKHEWYASASAGPTLGDPSETWTAEQTVTLAGIVEARFLHSLTLGRVHRTLLVARTSSGNGWLGSRADDTITMSDGGGWTRSAGAWATDATRAWARAWVTEPALSSTGGSIPDDHTCALVLQSAGALQWLTCALGTHQPSGSAPSLAPGADFATVAWDRTSPAVRRVPALTDYSAQANTAHGGALLLGISATDATKLKMQRVQDYLRTSREVEYTLPAAVSEISAHPLEAFENGPFPVVAKQATGWRVVLVTVGTDISRLDLPSPDQSLLFTSGGLTTASFVTPDRNTRTPALAQRAGHNVFTLGWSWDQGISLRDSVALMPGSGGGLMNHGGWHYFSITGCEGERAKLVIHQTPAWCGVWVGGTYYPADLLAGYHPEILGGAQWNTLLMATWFYTYDSPSTPSRKWYRLWETDYVFDGDCNGGAYVLTTPVFEADQVWISHDLVADVGSFVGDVGAWAQNSLVKWVNAATGDLLMGVGANATQPLSQVVTAVVPDPALG